MRFSNWLPSLALLAEVAFGSPVQQLDERNLCLLPSVRKEWRTLGNLEKLSFLNAVKCLHAKPAKLAGLYAGVTTRFEDFTAVHKYKTPYIHMTGLFLPWHRLFIAEYEKALKLECGYIGSLPYWDYTIDSPVGANFTNSPVFHNTYGFGGNGEYDPAQAEPAVPGVWGGGCVKTGPFKNFVFHVQRDRYFEYVTRCLKRNLWVEFSEWTRQDKEDAVYAQTNFRDMLLILEGTVFDPWFAIHSGGHVAVGGPFTGDGTAVDSWTSTLEPLFYLHHANIDRIWWEWQKKDASYKYQIGTSLKPRVTFPDVDDWNFQDVEATGATPIDFGSSYDSYYKNLKIGNVLGTKGETAPGGYKSPLCYIYAPSPKPTS